MEKVQKFCKGINKIGGPDQYGNNTYNIDFTDNTSGLFRCKDQDLFTVGVESTFYFGKMVGKSGKEYYKIERVEKHENDFEKKSSDTQSGGRGGVKSKEDIEEINRSAAIRSICILRGSSQYKVEDIIKEADIIFDYIQFGINDNKQQNIDVDDLPF